MTTIITRLFLPKSTEIFRSLKKLLDDISSYLDTSSPLSNSSSQVSFYCFTNFYTLSKPSSTSIPSCYSLTFLGPWGSNYAYGFHRNLSRFASNKSNACHFWGLLSRYGNSSIASVSTVILYWQLVSRWLVECLSLFRYRETIFVFSISKDLISTFW